MPFNHAIKVIARLKELTKTCACAESCTGGRICAALTSVPGSSTVFNGGIVAYANQSKVDLLGVDADLLGNHGAVHMEIAEQMASGARKKFGVDYAVATTGLAGPGGGSESKPIGLVFVAWADASGVEGKRFLFSGSRHEIQLAASQEALNGLLKRLED